jgi:hypothetical protein
MDSPRLMFGVNLKAGHVYHVPIAVHPDDGKLGDERWQELAEDAVAAIGVQGCRWVAVWHGPNAAGADHIHLAVQLVGDDGKAARLSYDQRKLRVWANEVEERLSLVRTARPGAGARALSRAEHERAKAAGAEPERRQLARLVRTAAAGAHNEVDFLAILKANDVDAQARVERGLVVGYSVALRPADDGALALRLAGGQLARDLTLPRLREHWRSFSSVSETDLAASDPRRAERWNLVKVELDEARKKLTNLDPDDRVQWNAAVVETADLVCVLAVRLERDQPGPLHRAGDALVDAARLGKPSGLRRRPEVLPVLARVARIASSSADPGPVMTLAVLAIVALLLYDLAIRQRYDQRSGQSGAALHGAAEQLAELRPAEFALATETNEVGPLAEVDQNTSLAQPAITHTPPEAARKPRRAPSISTLPVEKQVPHFAPRPRKAR